MAKTMLKGLTGPGLHSRPRQHASVLREFQTAEPTRLSTEQLHGKLAQARLYAKSRFHSIAETCRADQAGTFSYRALQSFSRVAAPQLTLSPAFGASLVQLDAVDSTLADEIGRDAAGLSILDGLHFVAGLYPALLPDRERGALGAFYTPPALCSRLIEQATLYGVDWRKAHVLDPAAGGGAFLLQAARRMREALSDCAPAIVLAQIAARLRGFELDTRAASLAQGAVAILLADLCHASGRAAPIVLRVCNTLEMESRESFDLVVGNPPYGRVSLTAAQRRRYARSLYGHANLYGVFTDIALRWAKPDGLVAYLTPASFLAGQYFSALRGLLAKEAPPVAIDFVHARRGVFEDVLQETLLAIYRKGDGRRRARIHYLHVANEREASVTTNGSISLPSNASMPWLAPRYPEQSKLIRDVESMTARLADWGYSVSTGPLVWNRFKKQLRGGRGASGVHPLIWAEAVIADGRFVFRAQKKNHSPYFQLEAGDGWLLVKRPCVLVQRTTAKEQARRLIAAELPADFVAKHDGVVVENHLNMVQPVSRTAVPTAVVAALLNSRVVDQVFRCMSGSVAVSAFELEALPLPALSEIDALRRLVSNDGDREQVEAECARLYGIRA